MTAYHLGYLLGQLAVPLFLLYLVGYLLFWWYGERRSLKRWDRSHLAQWRRSSFAEEKPVKSVKPPVRQTELVVNAAATAKILRLQRQRRLTERYLGQLALLPDEKPSVPNQTAWRTPVWGVYRANSTYVDIGTPGNLADDEAPAKLDLNYIEK